MDQNAIVAYFGADTAGLRAGLAEAERHTKQSSERIAGHMRRSGGKENLGTVAKGMESAKDSAADFTKAIISGTKATDALVEAGTSLASTFGAGLGIGTAAALLATLVTKLWDARKEAKGFRKDLAAFNNKPVGADQSIGDLAAQLDAIREKKKEVLGTMQPGAVNRAWGAAEKIPWYVNPVIGLAGKLHGDTEEKNQKTAFGLGEAEKRTLDEIAAKHKDIASIEEVRLKMGSKRAELLKAELEHNEEVGKWKGIPGGGDVISGLDAELEQKKSAISHAFDEQSRSMADALESQQGENAAQVAGFDSTGEGLKKHADSAAQAAQNAREALERATPDEKPAAELRLSTAQGASDAASHASEEYKKDQTHGMEVAKKKAEILEAEANGQQDVNEKLKAQLAIEEEIYQLRKNKDPVSQKQADDLERQKTAILGRQEREQQRTHEASRYGAAASIIDASTGVGGEQEIDALKLKLSAAQTHADSLRTSSTGGPEDAQAYAQALAQVKQHQNALQVAQEAQGDAVDHAHAENVAADLTAHGKRTMGQQALRDEQYQKDIRNAQRDNPDLIPEIQKKYARESRQSEIEHALMTPEERRKERENDRKLNRATRAAEARSKERIRTGHGTAADRAGAAAAAGMQQVTTADFKSGISDLKSVIVDKLIPAVEGIDARARYLA